ncbi:MAG: NAD(P)H-binding protein [Phycisphaera sp.]|nr:NAD(P)H-binding protein [Phycisphaera sp.]
MTDKRNILIQLDPDAQASTFDRVVAVDAGAEVIFSHHSVTPDQVEPLVHGAIFTRGQEDLRHTAIFIGGTDVTQGEALLRRLLATFFGPMRVSVMLDANGANTTAAAAVIAAKKHTPLEGATALVLGGTGPVGQRVAMLLGKEGATVRLASRSAQRAKDTAAQVNQTLGHPRVTGVEAYNHDNTAQALKGVSLLVAAGAAGVKLLSQEQLTGAGSIKAAIDLNAVPPAGIEGIDVMDKAKERHGIVCYGAIGVGGLKMKIHKAAIRSLFESNDKTLDAEAIYAIGQTL